MASHSGSSTSNAPPSNRTQASAGGTSSASEPVSFAFTRTAPNRPTSKIVTEAEGAKQAAVAQATGQAHRFDSVLAAYQQAKASGAYDAVKRWTGEKFAEKPSKAYAMTNQMEYFAESTESYFDRNDMEPFDRAELRAKDPGMLKALEKADGLEPMVVSTGQHREMLADEQAGSLRRDGLEFTSYLGRRIRFEIPGILMRRGAEQEQQNARFRTTETCAADPW